MDTYIQPLCIALTPEVFMHHARLSRCYFFGCNGTECWAEFKDSLDKMADFGSTLSLAQDFASQRALRLSIH